MGVVEILRNIPLEGLKYQESVPITQQSLKNHQQVSKDFNFDEMKVVDLVKRENVSTFSSKLLKKKKHKYAYFDQFFVAVIVARDAVWGLPDVLVEGEDRGALQASE